MIAPGDFFAPDALGLQQGDILLAGVSRISAMDNFSPAQWDQLDAQEVLINDIRPNGEALRLFAGIGLVMVTSHDCQMQKEWNRRRSELIAGGLSEVEAEAEADDDILLDRTLTASPLIDPKELASVDLGNLLAGHVVGYLPVPGSIDGMVPESVVDLNYKCTLDRLDVVKVASLTSLARSQLRYALVRHDALRTPRLDFAVEDVIGRRIEKVTVPKKDPLVVHIHLDDGQVIKLLQQPAEPEGPSARASVKA